MTPEDAAAAFKRSTALVARALRISPDDVHESFQVACEHDVPGILALRKRVLGARIKWDDARYLAWRYRLGSTHRGRGDCWVFRHRGEVIGMLGTQEICLESDDGARMALKPMDLAVDTSFGMHGVGAWMVGALCARSSLVLAIGSNENSRRLADKQFKALRPRENYFLPVRFRELLAGKIRFAWSRSAMAIPAGLVAAALRKILLRAARGISLRPIERFDKTFEQFLANVRQPGEVRPRQTVEYLNWRLFESPRGQPIVIGAWARDQVVGYMALQSQISDINVVRIVDWAIHPAVQTPAFRALCRAAARVALNIGADAVMVTAYHRASEQLLKRFGFMHHHSDFEFVGLAGQDSAGISLLLDCKNWCITPTSTDRDL